MTYNKSPATVDRWKHVLDRFLSDETVRIKTAHPHKLAYRLREALAAAREHNIEPYASINYSFSQEAEEVIARPKQDLAVESVEVQHTHFEGVASEFEVVEIMRRASPARALFPDFTGDYEAVREWADAKGYDASNDPLILLRRESGENHT